MPQDIISDDDYANLPSEPEEQFITIEAICRRNMSSLITQETPTNYDVMVRLSYMSTVAAAAEELGVGSLYPYEQLSDPTDGFQDFLLSANSLVTRLRIRRAGKNSATSVHLANKTRGLIEIQINKLREIISKSDLEDDRKKVLFNKLNDLLFEVSNPKVSFGKVMAILAHIGVGVGLSTGFLADAPEAIATITKLIGMDKEAELQEARRLGPPPKPKQLASPKTESVDTRSDYDDEVPF